MPDHLQGTLSEDHLVPAQRSDITTVVIMQMIPVAVQVFADITRPRILHRRSARDKDRQLRVIGYHLTRTSNDTVVHQLLVLLVQVKTAIRRTLVVCPRHIKADLHIRIGAVRLHQRDQMLHIRHIRLIDTCTIVVRLNKHIIPRLVLQRHLQTIRRQTRRTELAVLELTVVIRQGIRTV